VLGGARAMMQDGLYTRFGKPDFALALHDWPMAYGTIAYNSGPFTSNGDTLEITFKGRGGHGAAPDRSIDPIVQAARFVEDVQTVVSREKDMFEFGVVTVGAIQGGTSGNIIPASVTLRGTIRSYNSEVREKLHEGVRRTARAVSARNRERRSSCMMMVLQALVKARGQRHPSATGRTGARGVTQACTKTSQRSKISPWQWVVSPLRHRSVSELSPKTSKRCAVRRTQLSRRHR